MISLTKEQQSETYLSLLEVWDARDDVSRRTQAEVIAFHLPLARIVMNIAARLRVARRDQTPAAQHKHWRVDYAALSERVGSPLIARLALGLAGYSPKPFADGNGVEWSDCETTTGPDRNDLTLPDHLVPVVVH